jgi:hypothetical protein
VSVVVIVEREMEGRERWKGLRLSYWPWWWKRWVRSKVSDRRMRVWG